ncbi:DUF4936 family protein [Undibacterium terreum]|uniref:Uncharacterized protein n=1 Tax=Undibacterium terreum TaxID=1224302 RepID=A0A916XR26_9BURK|nr:DUF4936 family protein [Undibacterium terreum]GGD01853.1 hypothetical protein GCM10011396_56710 [Undibacterium terreum]
MDCYIYYRSAVSHQQQVAEQAGKLQLLLQKAADAAELKRRPEAEKEMHTWMEIYKNIPLDFAAQMEAALPLTMLPSLIDGPRHIEYFMDVPPCA